MHRVRQSGEDFCFEIRGISTAEHHQTDRANELQKKGFAVIRNGHLKGPNPGDVIWFPYDHNKYAHYATFPKSLPEFCITAACPADGTVLDPFAGTGTTLVAAKRLKRKYMGIELNPKYVDMIHERIKETIVQLDA